MLKLVHSAFLMRIQQSLLRICHKTISLSVVRSFLWYSIGSIMVRSISFITMPFIIRSIDPLSYGVLALCASFQHISIAFVGCGLRQFLSIEYFHCTYLDQQILINRIVILYVFIALPICFIGFYHASLINTYIFLEQASSPLIRICMGIIFLSFFAELIQQLLQYKQHASLATYLQLITAIISTISSCVLVYYYQAGVAGYFIGQLVGILCTTIIGLSLYIKHDYYRHASTQQLAIIFALILPQSIPFITSTLSGWLLASGDRWVIARLLSMREVGIYATADLSSQLFYFLILYPWAGAYLPHIMHQYTAQKNNLISVEQKNQTIMVYTMALSGLLLSLIYWLAKPLVYYLLPITYHEAYGYVLALLYGNIFLLGSYFASSLIQFKRKTYFLVVSLFIPALLNIFLNYLLIPLFGLHGCTSATLISYIIYFMITLWYNHSLQRY